MWRVSLCFHLAVNWAKRWFLDGTLAEAFLCVSFTITTRFRFLPPTFSTLVRLNIGIMNSITCTGECDLRSCEATYAVVAKKAQKTWFWGSSGIRIAWRPQKFFWTFLSTATVSQMRRAYTYDLYPIWYINKLLLKQHYTILGGPAILALQARRRGYEILSLNNQLKTKFTYEICF